MDPSDEGTVSLSKPRNWRRSKNYVKKASRYTKAITAQRVAEIAKNVFDRRVETKEIRFAHSAVGNTAASFANPGFGGSASVTGLFGGIAQGTGQNQRIGNRIFARGVRIFFPIQPANFTAEYYNNLRFICVSPKGGTAVGPFSTAAFVANVLSGGAANNIQWTLPVDTNRWRVHFDRTFFLRTLPQDGSGTSTYPVTKFLKAFVKINRMLQWDDGNNMINDVYLMAISDSSAVPNPGAIGGFVNCYFKDA